MHRRFLLPLLASRVWAPCARENPLATRKLYKSFYTQLVPLVTDDSISLYVPVRKNGKFYSSINLIVMGSGATSTNLQLKITELEEVAFETELN